MKFHEISIRFSVVSLRFIDRFIDRLGAMPFRRLGGAAATLSELVGMMGLTWGSSFLATPG